MKVYKREFNTIQDFLTFLRRPVSNIFKALYSDERDNFTFTQTHSYQEAYDLLMNGWGEGAKKINTEFNQTRPHMMNRSKSFNSVVGYQAHIPNYLNNSPLSMINKKMVKVQAPVITIVRNISNPHWVNADTMMEWGVDFLKHIADLENKGQRAKIILQSHIFVKNKQENILRIVIKHPDELLHIGKLAFMIAHPSMLRRICLRYIEVDPDSHYTYADNYGSVMSEPYLKEGEILYNNKWRNTI